MVRTTNPVSPNLHLLIGNQERTTQMVESAFLESDKQNETSDHPREIV